MIVFSDLILFRFKNPLSKSNPAKFAELITLWYSEYSEDFTEANVAEIKNFVAQNKGGPLILVKRTTPQNKIGSLPTLWKADSKLKITDGVTQNELLEFHEEEVARQVCNRSFQLKVICLEILQLSLAEFGLLTSIGMRELVSRKNLPSTSKRQHVEAMVSQFNLMSHRVASEIVQCHDFDKRVKWIEFWISVAEVKKEEKVDGNRNSFESTVRNVCNFLTLNRRWKFFLVCH